MTIWVTESIHELYRSRVSWLHLHTHIFRVHSIHFETFSSSIIPRIIFCTHIIYNILPYHTRPSSSKQSFCYGYYIIYIMDYIVFINTYIQRNTLNEANIYVYTNVRLERESDPPSAWGVAVNYTSNTPSKPPKSEIYLSNLVLRD